MAWNKHEIPDLTEQVMLVTGGNTGLGLETVRVFAEHGALVVLACRDADKGANAVSGLGRIAGEVQVMRLDLASLNSVRVFAETFLNRFEKLDVLVNNAGVMATPYALTEDGLELQQGVNHFGHFALTALLWPALIQSPQGRVVNVSSLTHRFADYPKDNLLFDGGVGYAPMRAYARSKLHNLLFTFELHRRAQTAGLSLRSIAAHPGGTQTELARHMQSALAVRQAFDFYHRFISQQPDMGALPQIRAALDPAAKSGEFWGPAGWFEMRGKPARVNATLLAQRSDIAADLWSLSEDLTQTPFEVQSSS